MYRRIRELREDHDYTQEQMSILLSCSQRVYSDYERGKVNMPLSHLIKIADFFDVSVDYILERTDNKKTNK